MCRSYIRQMAVKSSMHGDWEFEKQIYSNTRIGGKKISSDLLDETDVLALGLPEAAVLTDTPTEMLRFLISLLFFRSRGGERMGSRLFILEGPKMQRPYLPCMGRSTQFWWLPLLGFHFFCRETFGMTWIFPMHWQTGKIFGFAPIVVSAWNHVMVRVVVFLSTKCEQIRWKRSTEGTVCLCPVYFVHYSGSAIRTNAYWFVPG